MTKVNYNKKHQYLVSKKLHDIYDNKSGILQQS